MDSDLFRWIMVAAHLMVMPAAVYHRIQSRVPGERLDRRQEGWVALLLLRPFGLAAMVGLVAYMMHPTSMAWASLPLPLWLQWSGVVSLASGGALLVWTLHTLGANLTDTVVTRRDHTLVTSGPYHWVRHPFYDSAALWIFGNAAAANGFVLATGAVAAMWLVIRTRREEANLVARFGAHYQEYMARTGRFLPGAGRSWR
jgi:protein-S-isoprenylcysteine O-methyltransferase Ste14